MKQLIYHGFRIQNYSNEIIRIEKKYNNSFNDKPTFFVPFRNESKLEEIEMNITNNVITLFVNEYRIVLDCDTDNLIVKKNNEEIHIKNSINYGELPLPINTPFVYPVFDNPRIILKENGYTTKGNDEFLTQENVYDIYLIITDNDPYLLRKRYIDVIGHKEMVRLSTLGVINSRYYAYKDKEALETIDKFKDHNLPLDNFVIDTDWRMCSERGIGYGINTNLFPNMEEFFKEAHKRNIEIMFNDHPEPVKNTNSIFDYEEIKYRETSLSRLLKMGLDYWWYDRNWITKLNSPSKDLMVESLGLYAFNEITKNTFKELSNNEYYRRPIIMGNIVDVKNGMYNGIKDSASCRYSIQRSGDISYIDLNQEIENLIKCTNSCVSYYSSDIGGHIGNPSKEEYIRWIEFGAFEPIFRPHCTNNILKFREPWNYDEETINIYRDSLNLRYRLLPLIYKACYEDYINNIPMFRSISLNYPNDVKANNTYNSYMLDKYLLISPCFNYVKEDINDYEFVSKINAKFFNNEELKGEPVLIKQYDKLNFDLDINESIEKEVNPMHFSALFEFSFRFNEDIEILVAVDDGIKIYIDEQLIYSDWNYQGPQYKKVCNLAKNKVYKFKVEYKQGEGGAHLSFAKLKILNNQVKTYLPNDEFLSLNDGSIYQGEKEVVKTYEIDEIPLFIRLGCIIPLIENKLNTKELDWSKLTFDYYPSKVNKDNNYLYEDDFVTIAYKNNINRITEFNSSYDEETSSYIINILKAKGTYTNNILVRKILFKFENIFNDNLDYILLNNNKINYEINKINKDEKILNINKESKNNSTITFEFNEEINKDYEIKIVLRKK